MTDVRKKPAPRERNGASNPQVTNNSEVVSSSHLCYQQNNREIGLLPEACPIPAADSRIAGSPSLIPQTKRKLPIRALPLRRIPKNQAHAERGPGPNQMYPNVTYHSQHR